SAQQHAVATAQSLYAQQKYRQALQVLDARDTAKVSFEGVWLVKADQLRGDIQFDSGEFGEAVVSLARALNQTRQLPSPVAEELEASTAIDLAKAHSKIGKNDQAAKVLVEAYQDLRRSGATNWADQLLLLSNIRALNASLPGTTLDAQCRDIAQRLRKMQEL